MTSARSRHTGTAGSLNWAGLKQRALLARLLLEANRVVPRDGLIDDAVRRTIRRRRRTRRCRSTSRGCALLGAERLRDAGATAAGGSLVQRARNGPRGPARPTVR